MSRPLQNLSLQIGAPLLAATVGAISAITATKRNDRGPLNAYYAFNEEPLSYRVAMLLGAAGLGVCVLFLFARAVLATNTMSLDSDPMPWWTRSKPMIPLAVAATLLCVGARALKA